MEKKCVIINFIICTVGRIRMIKSRRMKWVRYEYRILISKPEGRPRHRKEENIKMSLRKIESEDAHWICIYQVKDRWWVFVKTVLDFRMEEHAGNFLAT
jgi:CRISPR/Cas system-associated endoribonuclease Cas2